MIPEFNCPSRIAPWRGVWLLLVLIAARPASAQVLGSHSVFVDGVGFLDIERRSYSTFEAERLPVGPEEDGSAVTGGGAVAVGTFPAPRVTARVEAVFPRSTDEVQSPYVLASAFAEPILSQNVVSLLPESFNQKHRERSIAVLAGYHTAAGRRFRVGYLAGVSFVQERVRTIAESSYLQFVSPLTVPQPIILRSQYTTVTYRTALVVGFDTEVAVASHLTLLPTIRVQGLAGSIAIRPGIGLRWIP